MIKNVIIYNTYSYFLRTLRLIFAGLTISILLALVISLLNLDLSLLRVWMESNFISISATMTLFLLVFWSRIMPTLRSIFFSKESSNGLISDRILVAFSTGIFLLIFAASHHLEVLAWISKNPAQLGYLGDFVILIAMLSCLASLFAPKPLDFTSSMFASDEPDLELNLSKSQQQAFGYLEKILSEGVPRSVAVTGDWGSGKSKVFQLAKNVAANKNNRIIWVDFDPWRYASEEALVKGFYETIASQLGKEIPGFQNIFFKITKSAEQLVSKSDGAGVLKYLASLTSELHGEGPAPDEIIKGLLEREGRRLVIALDDVERQYGAERTYRALQLVHHAKYMGSENVQVICIYEKATLLAAAPSHVPSKEEFLEKFSEIEINVAPPDEVSLRSHLEGLLSSPKTQPSLPKDFRLNLENNSIKNVKSHRGIIRAFNQIILEFSNVSEIQGSNSAVDERGYVDYTDRFLMSHIKLKYPLIFQDIARNRNIYTRTKDQEDDLSSQFMDEKDYINKKKKHFELLFDAMDANEEAEVVIKELLKDLFPVLDQVFNGYQKYIDFSGMRRERKIAHPDILDAYFAQTGSQDAYVTNRKLVRELIDGLSGLDDQVMVNRFSDFIDKVIDQDPDVNGLALLREELGQSRYMTVRKSYYRSWLRAVVRRDLGDKESGYNRELARVIGAINDDVVRDTSASQKINSAKYAFADITDYISNPHTGLLMLLFLLPERGNGFLTDYIKGPGLGRGGVFDRVLRLVDGMIEGSGENFFQKEESYWAFLAYQWALSVSTNNSINTAVPIWKSRYRKANSHFRALLLSDHKAAYDFFRTRFWSKTRHNDYVHETNGWNLTSEEMAPYDPEVLIEVVNALINSRELTPVNLKEIRDLKLELERFAANKNALESM